MLIAIGSENPVKISATKRAFSHYFEDIKIVSQEVLSGVSHQPFSPEESYKGARNRAYAILKKTDADFGVGIEGGIEEYSFGALTCGWVVIVDKNRVESVATSARMILPDYFFKRLKDDKNSELGNLVDEIAGGENLKQKGGMFGVFTHDIITREEAYYQGVVFALSRFVNKGYYRMP